MAALKILVGDQDGALKAVQDYFSGPFREQIVSSGEQASQCHCCSDASECLLAFRMHTHQTLPLSCLQPASDDGETGFDGSISFS